MFLLLISLIVSFILCSSFISFSEIDWIWLVTNELELLVSVSFIFKFWVSLILLFTSLIVLDEGTEKGVLTIFFDLLLFLNILSLFLFSIILLLYIFCLMLI